MLILKVVIAIRLHTRRSKAWIGNQLSKLTKLIVIFLISCIC